MMAFDTASDPVDVRYFRTIEGTSGEIRRKNKGRRPGDKEA
jgi:hypothetical protein